MYERTKLSREIIIEAVKQVTDHGHSVSDVTDRLGVTSQSIYNRLKKYGPKNAEHLYICSMSWMYFR